MAYSFIHMDLERYYLYGKCSVGFLFASYLSCRVIVLLLGRTLYETCNLLYLVFLLTDVGVVEASSEGYVGGTARTILNIW